MAERKRNKTSGSVKRFAKSLKTGSHVSDARLLMTGLLAVMVCASAACIGAYALSAWMTSSRADAAQVSADSDLREFGFELTNEALDGIPDAGETVPFSLSEAAVPELGDGARQAIDDAIDALGADVAFALVNVNSGLGIAHDADRSIIGWSTIKIHYVRYLCERYVESGELSLDDPCPAQAGFDTDGGNAEAAELSQDEAGTLRNVIRATVVYSDNLAYASLRQSFGDEGFGDWAYAQGAFDVADSCTQWYPSFSPRSALKLWNGMRGYLEQQTETSKWLESLLEQTEDSFIRAAFFERDDAAAEEEGPVPQYAGGMWLYSAYVAPDAVDGGSSDETAEDVPGQGSGDAGSQPETGSESGSGAVVQPETGSDAGGRDGRSQRLFAVAQAFAAPNPDDAEVGTDAETEAEGAAGVPVRNFGSLDTLRVLNKAGWISLSDSFDTAVNDAAIVEYEGETYLMCIMTTASNSAGARVKVGDIVAALFAARDILKYPPQQAAE